MQITKNGKDLNRTLMAMDAEFCTKVCCLAQQLHKLGVDKCNGGYENNYCFGLPQDVITRKQKEFEDKLDRREEARERDLENLQVWAVTLGLNLKYQSDPRGAPLEITKNGKTYHIGCDGKVCS